VQVCCEKVTCVAFLSCVAVMHKQACADGTMQSCRIAGVQTSSPMYKRVRKVLITLSKYMHSYTHLITGVPCRGRRQVPGAAR